VVGNDSKNFNLTDKNIKSYKPGVGGIWQSRVPPGDCKRRPIFAELT
jgi:hypothetical protein